MKYKVLITTQKVFCILLKIFVLFSSIAMIPTQVYAEPSTNKHYIIYQYSNGEISNDKIKFELYSTDRIKFDGHLQIKDNSGSVNFDDDVSGTIKYFGDHFERILL